MDAFAISLCKGMSLKDNCNFIKALIIGIYFGLFQFLMPIIGYNLTSKFSNIIINIDHWIAFLLLLIIGLKMIKDSILMENKLDDSINIRKMLPLSIATSIDALTVGITFSCLKVDLFVSTILIGVITFILSFVGVSIGNKVGERLGNKAEFIGGFILIVIGFKILFVHLNLI